MEPLFSNLLFSNLVQLTCHLSPCGEQKRPPRCCSSWQRRETPEKDLGWQLGAGQPEPTAPCKQLGKCLERQAHSGNTCYRGPEAGLPPHTPRSHCQPWPHAVPSDSLLHFCLLIRPLTSQRYSTWHDRIQLTVLSKPTPHTTCLTSTNQ